VDGLETAELQGIFNPCEPRQQGPPSNFSVAQGVVD